MSTTTDELATLRRQLTDLTDRQEIRDLVDRYVVTLDTHDDLACDDDWYRTIFTEDVHLEFPIGSYDRVAGLADFETAAKAKWDRTHHVSANCVVDLDGDRANVRAHFVGAHVHHPDGARPPKDHFVVGGFYEIEALRTAAGWRFRRLRFNLVWTAGVGLEPDEP